MRRNLRSWSIRLSLLTGVLLGLLLGSPLRADTVFYQPLSQHAAVSAAHWQQLWQTLRSDGHQQLIVEWTRHDDEDFGGEGGWLNTALRQAEQAGLQLVLGLHRESYYDTVLASLGQPGHSPVYFWHYLLSLSQVQRQRLQGWQLQPVAWYLPFELDDSQYRSHDLLRELAYQLAGFSALDQRPVHLRVHASGQFSPQAYAQWLGLLSHEGVQLWWQTGAMPEVARQGYREALPAGVAREMGVDAVVIDPLGAETPPSSRPDR